ncbi:MAG: ABC transporter ATP-binding protein [Candidatus Stahlbacteria bacterium]|nr:ABC transporter ATP-binding protein [candidate division WOR-3 bacterium]TET99214.1 MAG: ABC transporter ATP-binding protein [Candidatus Stahlbacteria bacterium]
MIKINSITIKRGKKIVIHDVSLSWHKGENLVILGPNGAGKTTLALSLAGMIEQDSGHIIIDSKSVSDYDLTSLRQKIGIVFQDPETQFVTTDVKREIAFGLSNIKQDREKIHNTVDSIIDKLDLKEMINRDPSELSGGEKQLVAIASIYAMSPDYIIFDEVTSFLDRKSRERIYRLWDNCSSSLLIITQNFEEIKWGDRVILLENGEISFESEIQELMEKDIIPTQKTLFEKLLKENKDDIYNFERIMEII